MPIYELEPAIPINKPIRGNVGPSKHFDFPFQGMDFDENNTFLIPLVSEHFIVQPGKTKSLARKQSDRVRHQALRYARNFAPGFKIRTRARNFRDHRELGIRVWRVR